MVELVVPVAADSDAASVKRLPSEWVFWYFIPNRSGSVHTDPAEDWSSYLHPLHSFDTIEDFGRILNSVEHPARLLKGCRYYVFRKDIRPLWEDPAMTGGSIVFAEVDKEPDRSREMEEKWIEIVLEALGSDAPHANSVLGVEYSSKPSSWRIALWVRAQSLHLVEIQGLLAGHFDGGLAVHVQSCAASE
jgi:translation initiation factor 4E